MIVELNSQRRVYDLTVKNTYRFVTVVFFIPKYDSSQLVVITYMYVVCIYINVGQVMEFPTYWVLNSKGFSQKLNEIAVFCDVTQGPMIAQQNGCHLTILLNFRSKNDMCKCLGENGTHQVWLFLMPIPAASSKIF